MRHLDFGRFFGAAAVLTVATLVAAPMASATATPTSAVLHTRLYNDDPFSTLSTTNSYPALISISDLKFDDTNGANRHAWRFSLDGSTDQEFNNGDAFRFCADLVISGGGEGEASLQLSPWWSSLFDGSFNVRTTDGEIACFGGRLPFYSFTGAPHLLNYIKGTAIHLEIIYDPNSLSMADPATIEYIVGYNANTYSSGPLPFDQGNASEDPPHGQWGILQPAFAGGHLQYFISQSPNGGGITADWRNICFEDRGAVAVEPTTWSNIKSLLH